MNTVGGAVVDLVFGITGTVLPADYELGLWRELVRCLPWLESTPGAGLHLLRTSPGGEGAVLLARRAKLVLRLPTSSVGDAMKLTGCTLNVGPGIAVGPANEKVLRPWATLHAFRVASQAASETEFGDEVELWLATRGIRCGIITGRRRRLRAGEREIHGWSVVLHDVADADSLCVQREGMGGERALGWGIFVPHKSIAAVT
jgi:CRISPR-associated protein Cas6